MSTHLDLDPDLLDRAMRVSGERTKKSTVTPALEEFITRHDQRQVAELLGKLDWDPSFDGQAERSRQRRNIAGHRLGSRLLMVGTWLSRTVLCAPAVQSTRARRTSAPSTEGGRRAHPPVDFPVRSAAEKPGKGFEHWWCGIIGIPGSVRAGSGSQRAVQSKPLDRIPFTVLGGFLGAGKTTLLNRWLRAAQGPRLAVLVNDFGAINLDADAVAQAGAGTIALSNGCVCCTIGDDLGDALGRVLAAEPPFDAVLVEASGVSDPWRIAQYALAEPRLQLQAVILLVDAAALAGHLADPLLADTLQRPLTHADLVVLNHADRADAEQLAAARRWVADEAAARQAVPAPVIATAHADLPLALLGEALYRPHGGGLRSAPADHGQAFASWQAQPAGPFDEARLRAWLRALPAGVLRLKGRLPLVVAAGAPAAWAELQYAGRHGSLRRTPPRPAAAAAVVAIGLAGRLPGAALAAGLSCCAAPDGDEPAVARRIPSSEV
ncbi:MAG: type II toxin-antitoxin system VapB family antitoxin [Burkholderiaceae bacterium]|nr:type II toxin-antitoxin system VapB family antitoxin [Burkholderiaceae bacterium]